MRYDVDVFTFGRKSVAEEKDRIRRKRNSRRRRRRQLQRRIAVTVAAAAAVIAVIAAVRRFGGRNILSGKNTGTTAVGGSAQTGADEVLHLSFPQLIVDDVTSESGGSSGSGTNGTAASGTNGTAATGTDGTAASGTNGTDGITVSEFNQILTELYKDDYVLVDFYSLTHLTQKNGYQAESLSLPEGKKPLVISVRGVSYEGTWEESGGSESVSSSSASAGTAASGTDGTDTSNANASGTNSADTNASDTAGSAGADSSIGQKAAGIEIDSSGAVVNDVRDENGTLSAGAYDVMTCVDAFVASYPDFSYNNARGVIAVTGKEGVLGYDSSDPDQAAALQKVVKALKDEGWIFASGTYGDISYGSEYSIVKEDAEKWKSEVGPQLGGTDILVLPEGGDIGSWEPYSSDNEKFSLLSGEGFAYYCVDNPEQMTWLETGTGYVRQGIHEISTVTEYETLIDQGIDAYSALVEKEAQQAAEELKSGGGDQASEGSGSDQSGGGDQTIENVDPEV